MKARSALTEVALFVLWMADKSLRPTFANLTASAVSWEREADLLRWLARQEKNGVVRREQRAEEIIYHLTDLGQLAARGSADPTARWERPWDGRWRQVLFDLPMHRKQVRIRLWRWLRANGFGYLQDSVWVLPDPVAEVTEALREFRDDVESFLVMEATCAPGYANAAIVNGAWEFEEINRRHQGSLAAATLTARQTADLVAAPARLAGWLRQDRLAWQHALAVDPLLPRVLWPKGYLGEDAWNARRHAHRQLATALQCRAS
jgi:phenylacetic acid degradation operon negative regulatory protein